MKNRVKKLSKKETERFSKYAIGLILTGKKKSCLGMKKVVNESYDCLYRILCKIKKFIHPIKYFSIVSEETA